MLDNAPLVKNFSHYPNYTFSGTTWNNFLLSNCLLLEKRLNPNSLHPPFSGCREWECSPWASLSPGLTPPVPFSCPSSDLSSRAFTNFVALLWMGWPQVSGRGNNHSLLWIWEYCKIMGIAWSEGQNLKLSASLASLWRERTESRELDWYIFFTVVRSQCPFNCVISQFTLLIFRTFREHLCL